MEIPTELKKDVHQENPENDFHHGSMDLSTYGGVNNVIYVIYFVMYEICKTVYAWTTAQCVSFGPNMHYQYINFVAIEFMIILLNEHWM